MGPVSITVASSAGYLPDDDQELVSAVPSLLANIFEAADPTPIPCLRCVRLIVENDVDADLEVFWVDYNFPDQLHANGGVRRGKNFTVSQTYVTHTFQFQSGSVAYRVQVPFG